MSIQPGPVLNAHSAIETSAFLYQLAPAGGGRPEVNLWGGSLTVHNGDDPIHLQRAVKLFLAAENMLAALEQINTFITDISSGKVVTSLMVADFATATAPNSKAVLEAVQAAITKATE